MDATCTIQDSIHVFSLVHKYVSRILGTYHIIGITFIAQNVALISPIHVLRMCGAERQPAQADRLARSAEEHPPLSDMIGTQTGFRMKTIIGMSVMSAQKRAMLENIFGMMAL